MIENLLDQGVFAYTMLGISAVAVLSQFLLNRLYKGFCKATENMATVKKPLIRQIKLKFENCFRVNEGVANIPAFVDKYLYQYRFLGMSLKNIRRIWGHMLLLNTLVAAAGAGLSVYYEHTVRETLLYPAVYGSCLLIMLASRYLLDERYHRRVMMTNLLDYLENTLVHRMKNEVGVHMDTVPEGGLNAAQRRKRRQKNAEAEIVQMKKSLEQIAAEKADGKEKEKKQEFTPAASEVAIIEDVIEEFLS